MGSTPLTSERQRSSTPDQVTFRGDAGAHSKRQRELGAQVTIPYGSSSTHEEYGHSTIGGHARVHFGRSQQTYNGTVEQHFHSAGSSSAVFGGSNSIGDDTHVAFLEALTQLRFDEIDSRLATIKSAHAKTCEWLLETPEYKRWRDPRFLEEHHGFLWLQGNPGTGKSTIMKFAFEHAGGTSQGEILVSFFFNARGAGLEKCFEGLCRSLLSQLFEKAPHLLRILTNQGLPSQLQTWPIDYLKCLLLECVRGLGEITVNCYVDALDECNEEDMRDMVNFFEELKEAAFEEHAQFYVCFASRHFPFVSFDKRVELILEGQNGHKQDIQAYIESKLRIGGTSTAKQLKIEVEERASGVFLWVALVVDILNKAHDGGRVHELRTKLRDIPTDLGELFRSILTRNTENTDELVASLQWNLYARRPLWCEELYYAIRSTINGNIVIEHDPAEVTADVMNRYILDCTRGLVEVSRDVFAGVRFIHETVREYLQKSSGLPSLLRSRVPNLAGYSHDCLKSSCQAYVLAGIESFVTITQPVTLSPSDELSRHWRVYECLPLLAYAVDYLFAHSNEADAFEVSQVSFLESACEAHESRVWSNLLLLLNVTRHNDIVYATCSCSLCYFASKGFDHLAKLRVAHRPGLPVHVNTDEAWQALNNAICGGYTMCAKILIDQYPEISGLPGPSSAFVGQLTKAVAQAARTGNVEVTHILSHKIPIARWEEGSICYMSPILLKDEDLLQQVLAEGITLDRVLWSIVLCAQDFRLVSAAQVAACIEALLKRGADANMRHVEEVKLLPWLCSGFFSADVCVKLIHLAIDHGASVDSAGSFQVSALYTAVEQGHVGSVEALVKRGANMELKDFFGRNALQLACLRGNTDMVRLLLDFGSFVDTVNMCKQTALFITASYGHAGCVEALLERGADIELADSMGATALQAASSNGYINVIRLLLDHGAFVNPVGGFSTSTALVDAGRWGRTNIVKMLLENVANTELLDYSGQTALQIACWNVETKIARLLLDSGAQVNVSSGRYGTPLQIAKETNREKREIPGLVTLLIERGAVE